MPRASVNGIELEYRTLGDAGAAPLLMVMGLGGQLTRWPEPLCRALADAGHYVVVYDNRDVGLSTRMSGRPRALPAVVRARLGLRVSAPYTLDDMALDAVGLLDALELPSAHVLGVSMGGMIGQLLAAHHRERVRSLTSIMSSSGSPSLPPPRLDVMVRLARPAGEDAETRIRYAVDLLGRISSPAYPPNQHELRASVERDAARCRDQGGFVRQLTAILASGSRGAIVRKIAVPTLIIHGAEDPLVRVAAARDLHQRIAHSRLEIVPGMGHDLPAPLLPLISEWIIAHARRAEVASIDKGVRSCAS
jgi:pimeloyl-ACP methyl ester carboxylesterase